MVKKNMVRENKIIVGLDEAGRGPLAGPVFSCAVTVQSPLKLSIKPSSVKDSKKMSDEQRKRVYSALKNCPQVKWGIGRVSEKRIDRINILQATKLSMKKAVNNLKKRTEGKVDFLLIDGNFGLDLDIPQKSIIKGDEKIFLIKIASIVAKVSRDKAMLRYHKKYPQYGFDRHKGYGTKFHLMALEKFGPCPIHRKTFKPVKSLL